MIIWREIDAKVGEGVAGGRIVGVKERHDVCTQGKVKKRVGR